MKRRVFVVMFGLLAMNAFADCKTVACMEALSWRNGLTAIVLNAGNEMSRSAREAIQAAGGRIAVQSGQVVLAWIKPSAAAALKRHPAISAVFLGRHESTLPLLSDPGSEAAFRFHAHVFDGTIGDRMEIALAEPFVPFFDCASTSPDATKTGSSAASMPFGSALPLANPHPRRLAPAPQFNNQTPYKNPQLLGYINVNVFFTESTGATDANTYTWNDTDYATALDEIYDAYTWWAGKAGDYGKTLSFHINVVGKKNTQYEPIKHIATDRYLWVNDMLTSMGYGSSPVTENNVLTAMDSYNASTTGLCSPTCDSAFSVVVSYNSAVNDPNFLTGGNAFAYYDGPMAQVLWSNGGVSPTLMHSVVAHETGHIFWACDEYWNSSTWGCQSCSYCATGWGPRSTSSNANCEVSGVSGCDSPSVSCLMKRNTLSLCAHTREQIGW